MNSFTRLSAITVLAVFFSLCVGMYIPSEVLAQGFEVLPVRQEVRLDVGKNSSLQFSLKNTSDTEQKILFSLKEVKGVTAQGAPEFKSEEETRYVSWVKTLKIGLGAASEREYSYFQLHDEGFVLPAKETVKIQLEFAVPVEERIKGHYFGAFFEVADAASSADQKGNVSIQYRLGSLVAMDLTTIPLQGELEVVPGKWHQGNDLELPVSFANKSNSHVRLQGKVWLTDLSQNWRSAEQAVNPEGRWLLPQDAVQSIVHDERPGWWRVANLYVLHSNLHINDEQVEREVFVLFIDWIKVAVIALGAVVSGVVAKLLFFRKKSSK